MNIDLTKLNSHLVSQVEINQVLEVPEELLKESELLDLKDTKVSGMIYFDASDSYALKLQITGVMVLPCAITLKPVDVPFSVSIDDFLENLYEEMGKKLKNIENSIDILPIIWENILMEIPMRIVNKDVHDVKLEGEGWKVITEERTSVNPELEKLKDLLQ